jgi:membrane protein involved in colicin uptake
MSRRSLRPQLNQIRAWVRQGRTDAWIAHQLEATVQQIQAFKREQDLEANGDEPAAEEVDLRAQDDAAIAAELEAEAARKAEEDAKAAEEAARRAAEAPAEEAVDEEEKPKPRRRRSTTGQDDPVYAEHWAGHRPVEVTIEEDQIVIRRAGGGEDDADA